MFFGGLVVYLGYMIYRSRFYYKWYSITVHICNYIRTTTKAVLFSFFSSIMMRLVLGHKVSSGLHLRRRARDAVQGTTFPPKQGIPSASRSSSV